MSTPKTAIVSLIFAIIIGGGIYLIMNLGSIAKPLTEKIASEALGVPVNITKMDIALKDKTVTVSGITIANPKGFANKHAITINAIAIALDNVAKDLITFKTITVEDTKINLEVVQSGTNLGKIQKNAAKNAKENTKKKPASEKSAPPINVIIEKFTLDKAKLTPSITLLDKQDLNPITLPKITARNIGTNEGGIQAGDAISQIIQHIIKVSSDEAGKAGFYQGLSTEALQELGINQVEQIKSQLENEVNKIGDSLKNIFK